MASSSSAVATRPSPAWYAGHPAGRIHPRGNFQDSICREGLGVTSEQYHSILSSIPTTLEVVGINPSEELRSQADKDKLTAAVASTHTQFYTLYGLGSVDAVSPGWVDAALRECILRQKNNIKRKTGKSSTHSGSNTPKPATPTPRTSHASPKSETSGFAASVPFLLDQARIRVLDGSNPRSETPVFMDTLNAYLHHNSRQIDRKDRGPADYDWDKFLTALQSECNFDTGSYLTYSSKDGADLPVSRASNWRFAISDMFDNQHETTLTFFLRKNPSYPTLPNVTSGLAIIPPNVISSLTNSISTPISGPQLVQSSTATSVLSQRQLQPGLPNEERPTKRRNTVISKAKIAKKKIGSLFTKNAAPVSSRPPTSSSLYTGPKESASETPVSDDGKLMDLDPVEDPDMDEQLFPSRDDEQADENTLGEFTSETALPSKGKTPETFPLPESDGGSFERQTTSGHVGSNIEDDEPEIDFNEQIIDYDPPESGSDNDSEQESTTNESEDHGGCLGELSNEEQTHLIMKISENPVITQEDLAMWIECCTFFKHDPNQSGPMHKVGIDGLAVGLYPHQVYAVYWMLKRPLFNPDVRGGFLGDEMGLGKTLVSLALVVVYRWLNIARREIRNARKSPNIKEQQKHLPVDSSETKCPSDPYPFACPCIPGSIGNELLDSIREGPVLIVAPPGLVSNWAEEAEKKLVSKHPKLRFEVFVQHGSSALSMARQIPPSRVRELQATITNDDTGYVYTPSVGQSKFIIITSSQSLPTKVQAVLACQFPSATPRTRPLHIQGVSWSIMIRDEFHKDKGTGTIVSEYFMYATVNNQPLSKFWQPNFPIQWALSGTPFERSPNDLVSHIKALECDSWSQLLPTGEAHPMAGCTVAALEALGKKHTAITTRPERYTRDELAAYSKDLNALLSLLMIRRESHGKFMNNKIINLPPMQVRDIICTTPPRFLNSIANLATQSKSLVDNLYKERHNRWLNSGRKGPAPLRPQYVDVEGGPWFFLRLCASFPAIASLHDKYPDWTFKAKEIKEQKLYTDSAALKNSMYYQHFNTLIDGSDKLTKLGEKLNLLMSKKAAPLDKMCLFSYSPAVTLILSMWFQRKRKDVKAFLLHPELSITQRWDAIESFSQADSKNVKNQEAYDAQVLISQISLGGTGFNLTRARYCGLFDLDYLQRNQRQSYFRVHRIGQTQETYLFLLHTAGNPSEDSILARQERRLRTADMTFAVTSGEIERVERQRQREAAQQRARENALNSA